MYRYRRHLIISQNKWLKKKLKHLRKKSYQFSTFSLREKKREHSLTHSMRSALPYYQNQTKTLQDRKITVPGSLKYIDIKILNKILANKI